LPAGGFVRSGQTAFNTGTGFFLGNSGGTPVFSVGSSVGNRITWNGSAFTVVGQIISGGPGGNIVPTSITGADIFPNSVDANRITAGTITTDRMTVNTIDAGILSDGTLGSIKFANTIQSADYVAGSTGWAITTGFDPNFQFGVAEFGDIVARGNIFAGSGTGERVEITSVDSTPENYRIWVGEGIKDDANGVFWVKANGDAKINKNVFDIGAQPNKGVASGSLTTGITNTSNGVTAEFSSFTSNGQPVLFEVAFSYFALNNDSNPTFCDVLGATTGALVLQRRVGGGSYSTISSASFAIPSSTFLFTDPDPFVADICRVNTQGEANRSLIDSNPPTEGTASVQYRIIIGSWSCALLSTYSQTGVVDTNAINASFTQ
jgi:hypothetical protein